MKLALPIACALLCLAACTAASPPPQPVACDVEKVATLPVRLAGGAMLVPARINGTQVQMQVDTGAETSSVTPAFAASLGLPADPHHRATVRGIGGGGTVMSRNTLVRNFEVGGQVWSGRSFVTTTLTRTFNQDPVVAGILGTDYLSDFDVELDLPQRRMTLWQVQGCSGDFAFHGVPHWRMALQRYWPTRMVVHVEIDGQPVSAMLSWGSNISILKRSAAERLGVTPAMLHGDPIVRNHGVDGHEVDGRMHRFSVVRIGLGAFRDMPIDVAPIHALYVDMLLGLGYARARRLWLSYATNQLFVVPPHFSLRPPADPAQRTEAPVPGSKD